MEKQRSNRSEDLLQYVPKRDPDYKPAATTEDKILTPSEYMYDKVFVRGNYSLYESCSLDDISKKVKTSVLKALNSGKGLYIWGNVGVGKTHLALACLKWWLSLGSERTGDIAPITEILDRLKWCINHKNVDMEVLIQSLIDASFLVIDDIGTQAQTEWSYEKIYEIVNGRWNNRDEVITIVTSNLNPDDLVEKSRDSMLIDRIVSRLMGMCEEVELVGSDRRIVQ